MAYLGQSSVTLLPLNPPTVAPPALSPDSPDYCDVYGDIDPSCFQAPAPQPSSVMTSWPEGTPGPPYTLPVEIFKTTIPIPVSRPEPQNMPIGTTLTEPCIYPWDFTGPIPAGCTQEPAPAPAPAAGPSPWWLLGLIGLFALSTAKRSVL